MKNRYLCTNTLPYFLYMRKIVEAFFVFIILTAALSCTPRDRYMTITGFAQGGTYTVKFNMNGRDGMISAKPQEIKDSVDNILKNIDMSLSGYNRKSLLTRFNEGHAIVPDSLFLDIYEHAYDIYDETSGIVDVASAPLFDLWGFGFTSDSLPSADEIAQVKAASGMGRLNRNIRASVRNDGTIKGADLLPDGSGASPELNYNAIAQGYSCDVVARYLYSIGVKDMLVDIGEIFCDGKNPKGLPWSLGIDRPEDGNNEPGTQLQGVFRAPEGPHGIVTSGNYRKFYVRDGRKYAHTIDPRTGMPVQHSLLSATVVAENAMIADAYATYCMVVGLDEAIKYIESRPDMEGCLIYDDGGVFRTWCSDGFALEEVPTSEK